MEDLTLKDIILEELRQNPKKGKRGNAEFTQKVTLRISIEQKIRLKHLGEKYGFPKSNFFRYAVEQGLTKLEEIADLEEEKYSFDFLIIELFNARKDLEKLKPLGDYIMKNKRQFCLVHLLTLIKCYDGYMKDL